MSNVIVLGSLITDLIARAPRLPHPGEVLLGEEFGIFPGGKGINQAVAAARLGATVTMIGCVGRDDFGDAFFPILERERVDNTYVTRDAQQGTGVSTVIISSDSGQNVIISNPRANLGVTAETVETALHTVREKHPDERVIFLTQCETSRISYTTGLQLAHSLGMTTILNAAPIPREPLTDDLFPFIDVLVVNETEAASLAQTQVGTSDEAIGAAQSLLMKGVRHVLVTLGAQGAIWCTHDENNAVRVHSQRPFAVRGVDATGAGDAFCGVLAAELAQERDIAAALGRASAAGALTATKSGAIPALPTAEAIEQLLTQQQE